MQYVAYYRVSTREQGDTRLGLDAQRAQVIAFAKDAIILGEFTEIESGKSNTRPELLKALKMAKDNDSVLLIAKLDRLSRNVTFISQLMDAKVKFKCCDMPEADSFTIHIFAALAQRERELISIRTSAALKELKNRGVKLGLNKDGVNNFTLSNEGRLKGAAKRQEQALSNDNNNRAKAMINLLPNLTLKEIADILNKSGFKTATGKEFTPTQVSRLK
jgi:DNA invertase Pin-like site-specific DNA recombinase